MIKAVEDRRHMGQIKLMDDKIAQYERYLDELYKRRDTVVTNVNPIFNSNDENETIEEEKLMSNQRRSVKCNYE